MGLYYHPNKKGAVEPLLSSIWENDFHGLLYRYAVEKRRETKYDDPMPRMPYSADEDKAKEIAEQILRSHNDDRDGLVEYLKLNGMLQHLPNYPEDIADFVTSMVDELLEFLGGCGGYEAS